MPKAQPVLKHHHQPIYRDVHGTTRFQRNEIVTYLLTLCEAKGIADLNTLALIPFTDEDRVQFAQLIGYSVCGFGDLSYVSDASYKEAVNDKTLQHMKSPKVTS